MLTRVSAMQKCHLMRKVIAQFNERLMQKKGILLLLLQLKQTVKREQKTYITKAGLGHVEIVQLRLARILGSVMMMSILNLWPYF